MALNKQSSLKKNAVSGGYTEPVLVCQRRLSKLLEDLLTPYLCYCSSLTLQREIKQLKPTVSSLRLRLRVSEVWETALKPLPHPVQESTQQAGNTLDLVLTNAPQRIENIHVKTNSPLMSDCYPVSLHFVPKAAMPTKLLPPWLTHQINKVRSLRKCMKRHPIAMLAMRLSEKESEVCSIIQSAKENYIAQLTTTFQSNPKKLYSYLNSLTKSKFESHCIQQDNRTIHNPYQRAIIFNEYFNSTFTTSNFTLPPNHLFPIPSMYLSEAYITEIPLKPWVATISTRLF